MSRNFVYINNITSIALSFLIILAFTSVASANDSNIEWKNSVYKHDSGYKIKRYKPLKSNNFDINIAKSKGHSFWHIQVTSKDPIKISTKSYILEFEANSNQDFSLYSRLGEIDVQRGNSYKDHSWEIIGDGEWHKHLLDFTGYRGNNFLYFQLGYAPDNTLFKIKDVVIKPVE